MFPTNTTHALARTFTFLGALAVPATATGTPHDTTATTTPSQTSSIGPARRHQSNPRRSAPRVSETPPPPRVNTCRSIFAADATALYRFGASQEVPAYISGGLSLDIRGVPDLIPINVEVDLDCQWQPWGRDATVITFHGDAGYGPHWLQTFAAPDRASETARQGFGVSDFAFGLRIPVNSTTLVATVGRVSSTIGWQGVARRLAPYWAWSNLFMVSPFSDTDIGVGVETSWLSSRLAVSAGPDLMPWSGRHPWWSLYAKIKPSDAVAISVNEQFGQGDNDRFTNITDIGIVVNLPDVMLGVYGLIGFQETPNEMTGRVENLMWGGVEAYGHGRFPRSIFGVAASMGYFTDGVSRTGLFGPSVRGPRPLTDVESIQGTLSLDMHPWEASLLQRDGTTAPFDRLLFNASLGAVQCLGPRCGFDGRAVYTAALTALFQWSE